MMQAHTRAAGVRLYRSASLKIKCLEIAPPLNGYWPDLWNANWSQSLIAAQVAQIASLGANCIKVTGSASDEGGHTYPSATTYRANRQYFLQQCRANNLKCYWTIGNEPFNVWGTAGNLGSTAVPAIAALAATLDTDGGDILIGIDVCNEFNNQAPTTWNPSNTSPNPQCISDMSALVSAVRAVTRLPLTSSLYVNSAAGLLTNAYIDLQYALGLDYHDVHLYYTSGRPSGADMVNLESRAKYLGRYLIGEMGDPISDGQAGQTTWFNGIGDVMRRPQAHGAVMFLLTDFENAPPSSQFGMYALSDTTFASPRLGMLTPFQTWPSNI